MLPPLPATACCTAQGGHSATDATKSTFSPRCYHHRRPAPPRIWLAIIQRPVAPQAVQRLLRAGQRSLQRRHELPVLHGPPVVPRRRDRTQIENVFRHRAPRLRGALGFWLSGLSCCRRGQGAGG